MAIDGVLGPISPTSTSGGRTNVPPVLIEDENTVIGTVDVRNEQRIENGARAVNNSVSELGNAPTPVTGGQANVSTDSVVIAQTAGEQSTEVTTAAVITGASAGTPEERTQGA
jgi:hypothetical protein